MNALSTLRIYGGRGFVAPRRPLVTIFRRLARHRSILLEFFWARGSDISGWWSKPWRLWLPVLNPCCCRMALYNNAPPNFTTCLPELASVPFFAIQNEVVRFLSELNYILREFVSANERHPESVRVFPWLRPAAGDSV